MRMAPLVACVSALVANNLVSQQRGFPILTGPYLGQKPPGKIPEVFAPGVVSRDADFEHSAAVFSPDGREVFWCARRNRGTEGDDGFQRLYYMKVVDGRWTAPQVAPFTQHIHVAVQHPVFSPDGSRLYFERAPESSNDDDIDIYVVERQGEGWSVPVPVSALINSPAIERLHSVTADGSIYFTRNLMTSNEEVLVSRFVDGAFAEPERLGADFNSDAMEFAIAIAPNEQYMLISQVGDPRLSDEVFISYRNSDGTWAERIKTPYTAGGFLALSPDGKYLFMLGEEGIYWVSTSFIEELRPRSRRMHEW